MVVAVLGGVLGILMMIPLRRAFIVKQHGTLNYPEGTACADVLIVGEQGGRQRQDGVPGLRHRLRLPVPHAGPEAVEGDPQPGTATGSQGAELAHGGRSRRCWAWATSSARGSPASWWPAASWPTWCSCRRSTSSATGSTQAAVPRHDADPRHGRRTPSATATCSTSAPGPWPPAGSSACSRPCR